MDTYEWDHTICNLVSAFFSLAPNLIFCWFPNQKCPWQSQSFHPAQQRFFFSSTVFFQSIRRNLIVLVLFFFFSCHTLTNFARKQRGLLLPLHQVAAFPRSLRDRHREHVHSDHGLSVMLQWLWITSSFSDGTNRCFKFQGIYPDIKTKVRKGNRDRPADSF